MPFITSDDGAQIFYKDWGTTGTPVILSHGWPLNADAWEVAALFLAEHGHRAIAHDRRGHGRSSQTWHRNEMDTSADDLATLIETLDLSEDYKNSPAVTDYHEFEGRDHWTCAAPGWEAVADYALEWAEQHASIAHLRSAATC